MALGLSAKGLGEGNRSIAEMDGKFVQFDLPRQGRESIPFGRRRFDATIEINVSEQAKHE